MLNLFIYIYLKDGNSVYVCLDTQLCLTLCNPIECSPPGSFVHGDSLGKNTEVGCHALLQRNLPNPGMKPKSPALQMVSLLSEPPGEAHHNV